MHRSTYQSSIAKLYADIFKKTPFFYLASLEKAFSGLNNHKPSLCSYSGKTRQVFSGANYKYSYWKTFRVWPKFKMCHCRVDTTYFRFRERASFETWHKGGKSVLDVFETFKMYVWFHSGSLTFASRQSLWAVVTCS